MRDCPYSAYSSFADSLATATTLAVRQAAVAGGHLPHPSECAEADAAKTSPCTCCCSICGYCDRNALLPMIANTSELSNGSLRCCGCPRLCGVAEGGASLSDLTTDLLLSTGSGQYPLCRHRCCPCHACTENSPCEKQCESASKSVSGHGSPVREPFLPAAAAPTVTTIESNASAKTAGASVKQHVAIGDAASPAGSGRATIVSRETPERGTLRESSANPVVPSPAGRGVRSSPKAFAASDTPHCRKGAAVPRSPSRSLSGNPLSVLSSSFSPRKPSVTPGSSQAAGRSASLVVGECNAAASSILKQDANVSSLVAAHEETDESLQPKGASAKAAVAATEAASSLEKRPTTAENCPCATDSKATAETGPKPAAEATDRKAQDESAPTATDHSIDPPLFSYFTYLCPQHPVVLGQDSMGTQAGRPAMCGLPAERDTLQQEEAEELVAALAPQVDLAPFFEALKVAGIVLVRREDAQRWRTQLALHQQQGNVTRAQLKAKSAEVAEAHRKLHSQTKTLQESTTRFLSKMKATKVLEQALATATTDLEAEKETTTRLQRDKKALCRTIERLKEKLSRTENELTLLQKQTQALQQDRRRAETRNNAYRKNLKGLGDVQNSLTEELAAERMEKRVLKKLFEEKLVHIQQQRDTWQQEIDRQDSVVQRWKEMLAQERSERQGAELQQQRLTEQLEELQAFANDLAMQKEDISLQLRQQTEVNDKLQRDFEAVSGRLQRLERRRRETQLDWMRDHLRRVDARRASRNSAPQHGDATAQVDIDPVFGEPFPPLDITTAHSLKRPFANPHTSLHSSGEWVRPEEVTY